MIFLLALLLFGYICGTIGGFMSLLFMYRRAKKYIQWIDGENRKTDDFEQYMRKVHNTGGYGRLQTSFKGFIESL